jgi:two-component system, cell cycle sensor histidine kinase and response regulator CckA
MSVLRILHLEDNANDAELVRAALAEDRIDFTIDRVSSKSEYEDALRKDYDVILSDFSLPAFDGLHALALAKQGKPDVPFLFVSGTIGEERAIESLKGGAVDYILKDRLIRLSAAILRAHRDALNLAERQRHEKQIRRQAELLDQAQDAIFVQNLDRIVTYWNKGAERIYGWTTEEIIEKRAPDFLAKIDGQREDEIWKSTFEKGQWTGEITHVTKDGKEIVMSSRRTLLRDVERDPLAILNINTDITEKKNLEAQVLRNQRIESIGALAGGIAHDLNNVLAPMMMVADLIRDDVKGTESLRMLDILRSSAQRGAELVKQILQFARGAKGQASTDEVKKLLDDLANLLRKTFPPSIHIEVATQGNLPSVASDPTQLNQILMNLCVNARDAMPKGGTITIEVRRKTLLNHVLRDQKEPVSGSFVEFAVSDTGTGIAPEILTKIFDPFFTTKAETKGTGLGLATVATILKNHHGFIEVDSIPGKGSTFRVTLPTSKRELAKAPTVASTANVTGRGLWILLVDDELALLEMTKGLLEAHQYQVLTATNGAEALMLFEANRQKIAAVVTDLLMPGMGGNELVSTLCDQFPGTRILCMTGSTGDSTFQPQQCGAQVILRKPCPTDELLAALDKLLR